MTTAQNDENTVSLTFTFYGSAEGSDEKPQILKASIDVTIDNAEVRKGVEENVTLLADYYFDRLVEDDIAKQEIDRKVIDTLYDLSLTFAGLVDTASSLNKQPGLSCKIETRSASHVVDLASP